MTLDSLRQNRTEVLWWEFCCLLHDIGKLSDEFLHYRQVWHALKDGYASKDPHDHFWFEKDTILKEEFGPLLEFFLRPIMPSMPDLSVVNAVHHHVTPSEQNLLCRILKRADGIDSRYDRNNPLLGCEQTVYDELPLEDLLPRLPIMYRGNVFGRESPVRSGRVAAYSEEGNPIFSERGELHEKRRSFYEELTSLLNPGKPGGPKFDSDYETFRNVRKSMKTLRGQSDVRHNQAGQRHVALGACLLGFQHQQSDPYKFARESSSLSRRPAGTWGAGL